MNKHTLISLLALTLGLASATGLSPVPGSGRPDAFARAGDRLPLRSLGLDTVTGAQIQIPGVPPRTLKVTVNAAGRTELTVPDLPPGRVTVTLTRAGQRITRELDVLPPTTGHPAFRSLTNPGLSFEREQVLPDQVQVLLNPALTGAALNRRLETLRRYGTVTAETLRLPTTNARLAPPTGSPCGGTLAVIQLGSGQTLEEVLNALLADNSGDIWYPDPISSTKTPAALAQVRPGPFQSAPLQQAVPGVRGNLPAPQTGSFYYQPNRSPLRPGRVLGAARRDLGGAGSTIAVLDTGFSAALDLHGELPSSRVMTPLNALQPAGAGTFSGTDDFWEGHGTQVAILAAGGQSGVAPQATALPIKVCAPDLDGRAVCTTRSVLRGVCLALDSVPANRLVLNLSLGGSVPTNAIHAALNWAEQQGAVVVAAGGNQGLNGHPPEYPAAFARPGVGSQRQLNLLAVASVRPGGPAGWTYSGFSTRGNYLNVSAPGEALNIGHPYLYSGTSFAAPLVAGAAALVQGAGLNLTPATPQNALRTAVSAQAASALQAVSVKAFMLSPARVRSMPGIEPTPDLSKY